MNKEFKEFCDKKKNNFEYYSEISLKKCSSKVNILLGPNGCGKSMSIRNIEEYCKKKNINYISYSTSYNDIVKNSNFDPFKLACAYHSEGERMCDSFFDWANSYMLKELLTNKKDLVILIDEADSGLSIDRLMFQLNQLLEIIKMELKKNPSRNIKFIFTCNSYEMYEILDKFEDCKTIWVPTKEIIHPKNYKQFTKRYKEYYFEMKEFM